MPPPEIRARINRRIEELYLRHLDAETEVASYYASGTGYVGTDSAGDRPGTFGIGLASMDGETFGAGDVDVPFPLHSLSKVFVFALALEDHGRERVHERVGVEPSGDAFHSISFDERRHRPHNPMVNAGALATTDLVEGADGEERLGRILDMLKRFAANDAPEVDQDIFELELASADRNRATAYLMRSESMIGDHVEDTLALYLKQCSVMVTARDLAVMAGTIANGGMNPVSGERVLSRRTTRDVLTVMYTCGMYDYAGEWAYEVGVPAKSGVSGGIMASVRDKMGVGVLSPGLDTYGNSVRGVNVCHEISERLGVHVFATEAEDAIIGAARSRGAGLGPTPGSDTWFGARRVALGYSGHARRPRADRRAALQPWLAPRRLRSGLRCSIRGLSGRPSRALRTPGRTGATTASALTCRPGSTTSTSASTRSWSRLRWATSSCACCAAAGPARAAEWRPTSTTRACTGSARTTESWNSASSRLVKKPSRRPAAGPRQARPSAVVPGTTSSPRIRRTLAAPGRQAARPCSGRRRCSDARPGSSRRRS